MNIGVILVAIIALIFVGTAYADTACDQANADAASKCNAANTDASNKCNAAYADAASKCVSEPNSQACDNANADASSKCNAANADASSKCNAANADASSKCGSQSQQAASDAESARQQAASDAESARQQAASDAESARQQVASDFESFLQQSTSDFRSKVEENRERKVNLEVVSELDESGETRHKLVFRGVGVSTNLKVESLEDGDARIRLSDGNYQDINVMPSTAFKIALEKLKSSNVNIRIEEFGGKKLAAVYVADTDKKVKVLGFFQIEYNLEVEIDIESGEINVEEKPWWWFFVEEVDEIEETELQLIKQIQDITLIKNEKASLSLNEYFLNAESYSVSNAENVLTKLNKDVLTITPETNWTGTNSITVTAHREKESLEARFNIIVSENELTIQTLQYGAILNEPVKWKKSVNIEEQKKMILRLPKNSENIVVKTDTGIGEIISSVKTDDDLEIQIEEDEDYEVEYYTEAPYSVEKDLSAGKQEITITGSDDVHYTDVLAYKYLPVEVPTSSVKLSLITESGKKDVAVEKYDLNKNGLIDYIEWIVPILSNETYELELNIIDIQSYPTVGDNWEVRFNTTGTANLTISAIDDTTYGNSAPDDLTPLELRCGNDVLNFNWQGNSVFYSDWNCDNETARWIVGVLTSGVHTQEFNFGGLVGHANNFASENISFVSPTPQNNSIQNTNSVYVNLTSQEALNISILRWGNSSGYTNLTMSNSSTTNWFRQMTSLSDGNYNFSVLAQNVTGTNVSGTWVQTGIMLVSIDTVAPTISIDYPLNTTYNVNVSQLNYTSNGVNCWYSRDSGATNSSSVSCTTDFTNVVSVEGSNTWTVYSNDSVGNYNSTNVVFFKDTVYPQIDYSTGTPSDNANLAQSYIFINVTVTEANEDMVTFSLYNSTQQINSTSYTDSTRLINWTSLGNMIYTYNVTINDTLGNSNTTATRTVTLDTVPPVTSFSCSKSSLIYGEKLICSCSATDNIDSSPSVSYSANPPTDKVGTFTTTCSATDDSGNSVSSTIAYTVESEQVSGGPRNYKVSSEDLTKGYTQIMRRDWKMTFNIGSEIHTALVKNITEESVFIVLSSEPQEVNLAIGEEKKFELTGDNYYDVTIKLNHIEVYPLLLTANLTILSISEEILEPEKELEKEPEAQIKEGTKPEIKDGADLAWLQIIIIVIIILVLIKIGNDKYGWLNLKSKKNKKPRRK